MQDIIMVQNWPISCISIAGRIVGEYYNEEKDIVKLHIDDSSGADSVVIVEMTVGIFLHSRLAMDMCNYGKFVEANAHFRRGKTTVDNLQILCHSEQALGPDIVSWLKRIEYRESVLKKPWFFQPENKNKNTSGPVVCRFSQRELTKREERKKLQFGLQSSIGAGEEEEEKEEEDKDKEIPECVLEDSLVVNKTKYCDAGIASEIIDDRPVVNLPKESVDVEETLSFELAESVFKRKPHREVTTKEKVPVSFETEARVVDLFKNPTSKSNLKAKSLVKSLAKHSVVQVLSSQSIEETESLKHFDEITAQNKSRFVQLVKECLVVIIKHKFQTITLKELSLNRYVSSQIKAFAHSIYQSGMSKMGPSDLQYQILRRLRLYFRNSSLVVVVVDDDKEKEDKIESTAFKLIYDSLCKALKNFTTFDTMKYIAYVKHKRIVDDIDYKLVNFLIKYRLLETDDKSWKYQKATNSWYKV
ncbi:hypothetical protein KGF56_004675 [Candida oxycetoniae]|uniref:CST complex subunit Stn1 N-terminal domain-containing protein n=1 Tax=Candida oxycetoniae TaxID=497107 RepID=A0AAI9STM4_9ASCO|nr:uncharacterized protein KGF56_004675 [Candida oxycetoniae]KAI3402583.2 hypothetical protein KGF56_004675 [Candida oxycetoniae]